MPKYLLLLVAFFSTHFLQAQTFNNNTGGPIADGGATPATTCFPITVAGVGSMTATHGLESVCININHTWDADLTINLQAPDGTLISLSIANGGSGDNYSGTCFSATGAPGIGAGTPPFAGTYLPQGSLGGMNNGQNGDGIWNLCVEDGFAGEIGTVVSWSITFSSTPYPPTPTCANNPPAGNACQVATPVCNFVGYCGNTSSIYAPPHVWPELTNAFGGGGQCGPTGGSIENNSFVTFVASATSASFNVWVTNSTLGNGIQMMFYNGNCGSGAVSVYGCYANPNLTPTTTSPHLISASGLVPGDTYTLMFDGYAGDVCDYSLAPLSGVNILFVDPPSPSVCIGQSVVLSASGGNGIYNWTGPNLSSTTGTPVTASPAVTSSYTVTSVDPTGSCPVDLAFTITITNTPNPPTVTSPVNYCQNAAAVPVTAVGNLLEWYTVPTGGTSSTTAPTPITTTIGTTTYYVTQTLSCGTSIRVPVIVNVVAPPPAPTVTSTVGYCQGASATALTATGTGLLWYTAATGGTGSATAPIPSTATVGSTIYYVSQTISGCEGPRAAITVTIGTTPAAPTVTSPVSYCQGTTSVPLTATGTNLLWYTVATGGVGSATAPTPSTASVGTFTWYVDQANGGCRGPRVPIVVNVGAATPPPGTTNITYCQGGSATALTAVGTSLLWYTVATGGTGSSTAPTPSTATVGNTTYYVTQTLSCGESVRQPLIVTITTTPPAPGVTSPVSYCQNATATVLTATGTGLLWYTTATGGTGTGTAPTPVTSTVGSTTYYVSQATGSCEGPRSAITVTINNIPPAPGIIVNPGCDPLNPICPSYCQGATATPLSAIGTNLLWYTTATGGTGSSTAPTPSTSTVGNTIYYVSQTVNGCEGPRLAITVSVVPPTSLPTATTPITYCQGASATALTATGTGLLWYSVATGGTGSATAPTPSTAATGSTTYYVSQTAAPCGESARLPILVNVNPTPAAPTVTSPVNYCQNVSAVALSATGTALLWYTTATGGTGSATAPIPLTNTVGNTTYYVSQTTGTCEGPRAAITVNVGPLPSAPGVTAAISYCQNTTAIALTATGSNLLWYTTATGGTGNATAPIPSTATQGNFDFYVSQTINGCEGPRSLITVTILPPTALPTATTPINYCQGGTATALTATGTGLLWYTTATGGTGSVTAPTPSTATPGSTTYYVSQTLAPCGESARFPILVTINPTPGIPSVTSPVVYCQNATAAALTATGTSLLWYTTASGGTGSATAPVPSTAIAGSTTYYVSQSTGTCEGPRTSITVTVNSIPVAPAVTATITYCQNITPATLTATGTNLLWYSVATGGTGSATAPTPSTATPGNFNFYVSQTINSCEGPRALITVTVLPSTILPTATSPVTYCQGVTPAALTANGTSLLWYMTATGGTGGATAPTPSTVTPGSTTYYVSQTLAPCGESARLPILVTINPTPGIPSVTSPVVYCQNATAAALTATGTSLLWYTTASGGTGSATAPVPSTAIAGSTTYYVSQSTGTCEGPRTSITVTVNSIPVAPAVTATITYCQNITPATLTATGTNLLWYSVATGGTGSATAPTPSTATPGNFNFYVSQTINSCEGPRALITVTVLPSTILPTAISPVTYCQGVTPAALTANGTSLLWYMTATGGTGSATAPTPSTVTPGSTTYYVSQTLAPCGESARLPIVVTINPTPGIPSVTSPVVYCQNTTAAALTATGTSLLWYTTATGGTGSAAAPTPSTATPGSTTYYVSQSLGMCEGPRTGITVTVNATPVSPGVTAAITYCQDATATALTATGSNLLWYSAATGGTGNTTAPTPSTTTPGDYNYYVSQTILSCEGPRSLITVTILPHTSLPTATSPIEYCQGTTATSLTATGTSLLWYTSATGGTGTPTAPIPSTVTAGSTTYYVSQTAAPCGESARLPIVVNINPTPAAPAVDGPLMYCQDAIAPPLSATGTNLLWYNTPLGGTGNPNAPDQYTQFVGVTTYYVSQAIGVCEGPRASITVTINPYPDFGPDLRDTACVGDSINLSALFNTSGVTYNWTLDGAPVDNPAAVKVSGVYQLEAINSVGCSDTVLVWVTIQPAVPAFAGNDTTAIIGTPHTLVASGGVAYEWTPAYPLNLATIQNPVAILDHDQLFEVKVTDVAGCVGTDKVFIQVYNGPTYYVPNAFSPNGDGQNDLFKVVPVGISRTDWFRVFNRFGQMVFETNKWMMGWDGTFHGKKQPAGNYVWMVKGVDKYGKIVEMKGTVLIVQ